MFIIHQKYSFPPRNKSKSDKLKKKNQITRLMFRCWKVNYSPLISQFTMMHVNCTKYELIHLEHQNLLKITCQIIFPKMTKRNLGFSCSLKSQFLSIVIFFFQQRSPPIRICMAPRSGKKLNSKRTILK